MFHSRIRPLPELEGAFHSLGCDCVDCEISRDPIAYNRRRRLVRFQAAALIVAALALYGTLIACAPAVAASFGISR